MLEVNFSKLPSSGELFPAMSGTKLSSVVPLKACKICLIDLRCQTIGSKSSQAYEIKKLRAQNVCDNLDPAEVNEALLVAVGSATSYLDLLE